MFRCQLIKQHFHMAPTAANHPVNYPDVPRHYDSPTSPQITMHGQQFEVYTPGNSLRNSNSHTFEIQIHPELRSLQQKYSQSIIPLFPYENSPDYEKLTHTPKAGHWKSANFVRLPHNAENTAILQQNTNQQRYINSVKKWDIIKREVEMLNKFISEIGMGKIHTYFKIKSQV